MKIATPEKVKQVLERRAHVRDAIDALFPERPASPRPMSKREALARAVDLLGPDALVIMTHHTVARFRRAIAERGNDGRPIVLACARTWEQCFELLEKKCGDDLLRRVEEDSANG